VQLARARVCVMAAAVEPPRMLAAVRWAGGPPWGRLLAACDALATRLAALEAVQGEGEHALCEASLAAYGLEPLAFASGTALASVAAASARLARALQDGSGTRGLPAAGGSEDWPELAANLRGATAAALEAYGRRMGSDSGGGGAPAPSIQRLRAVCFVATLAQGVLAAAAELDAARAELRAAGDAASSAAPRGALAADAAWAVRVVRLAAGAPQLERLRDALAARLPALATRGGAAELLQCRFFQAGAKYWGSLCVVMALLLALGRTQPAVAAAAPSFAFTAACLTATERVESTVSRSAMWVGGTALGGGLGALVMLREPLAASAVGVAAVCCAAAAAFGLVAGHQFRVRFGSPPASGSSFAQLKTLHS
jgi:hypothetical protein